MWLRNYRAAGNVMRMSETTGTTLVRNLIPATGSKVHAPAMAGQKDTSRTKCAPLGRMGTRRPSYRWTDAEVTCTTCRTTGDAQ